MRPRALVLLALLAAGCGPEPEPPPIIVYPKPPLQRVAVPAPKPPAEPAYEPPHPHFEGTWITDQGVLVFQNKRDGKEDYGGLFLPARLPAAHFYFRYIAERLEFASHDLGVRWTGSFAVGEDRRSIAGELRYGEDSPPLPCRGKRIGASTGHGIPALLEALGHPDPWIRRGAADGLGALGPPARDAIPGLIDALRDDDEEVRRSIHLALARLGAAPERALDILRCHLKSDVPRVRTAAAEALDELGALAFGARADLAAAAADRDLAVRVVALEALLSATNGDPAGLAEVLNEETPGLAAQVVEALRRKGAATALASLAERLLDPPSKQKARDAAARATAAASVASAPRAGHDWNQWRGPRRDNVSLETGLLKCWPAEGPPVAWETWGIGDGISGPAVRDGRVFVLGYLHGWEYLNALDADNGRRLWSARLGPGRLESSHMRWVAQRVPTVGPDLVYAFLNSGELVALRTRDGREAWRLSYPATFGPRRELYGVSDRPLLDGERLICTPASADATIAALDASTGSVVWKTLAPQARPMPHPSILPMEVDGVRLYVVSAALLHGFRAVDGRHLWSTPKEVCDDYLVTTPLPAGPGRLLMRGRSGKGSLLWRILPEAGRAPELVGDLVVPQGWLQDSSLILEDRVFTAGFDGIGHRSLLPSKEPGREVKTQPTQGDSAMTAADGSLYMLDGGGNVSLLGPTSAGLELRSSFRIPHFVRASGAGNPVVARGHLHLRDGDRLLCYDVRESPPPGERAARFRSALDPPDSPPRPGGPAPAVFVPTPRDVVERLLALAEVKEKDVVVDLGSGDGRIPIAAARGGAKAVGYEIDPALVKVSREAAAGLDVRIEARDLFTADLSEASVVALYLPEEMLVRLKPQLAKLKPGARVVSHQFKIPGVKPDRSVLLTSREDPDVHAVHLWTAPLKLD